MRFDRYHDIKLPELPVGGRGVITEMPSVGRAGNRLRDLGFTKGAVIEKTGVSPLGDPSAYLVGNAVIAVRKTDASLIAVRPF